MTRLYLTHGYYGGEDADEGNKVYIHAISVKDNFVMNINKFNTPILPGDDTNMETNLIPLGQGNRTIEVMGYIHVDMFTGTGSTAQEQFESKYTQMLAKRTLLINFTTKNAYTWLHYENVGDGFINDTSVPIMGYIQGLEIREVPTGTPKPEYFMVIFNIIDGNSLFGG